MTAAHAWVRSALVSLVLLAIGGCGQAEPPPPPKQEPMFDPKLATHPDYKTPEGWRTECVGRQLIDVPADMEWALADRKDLRFTGAVLTEKLSGVNDVWRHDGMTVGVSPAGDAHMWRRIRDAERNTAEAFVNSRRRDIESYRLLAEESAADGSTEGERRWLERIRKTEAVIAGFRELGFGIPDSFIRTTGGEFRAFLWRNSRVYQFIVGTEPEDFAENEAFLRDYLSRFRPRALYEIPTEPGVCYPYAFVADNGRRWFDIKDSFRLADAPGVVYSIRTNRNTANPDLQASFEVLLMGSPFMRMVAPGTGGGKKIAQQEATMGPYRVWIGGIVMPNREAPGDGDYYRAVSAFTGQAESDVLPGIRFEMNGYARGFDPSIDQPTPPIDTSLERMRAIMKSVRLRQVGDVPR